jgi:uncharacterized protein YbjT (DUF2867 family)
MHAMNSKFGDFAKTDSTVATNMASAAAQSGLARIIYLGGLGEDGDKLSKHLRSRADVADILRSGAVPVTVLRAAMIIGAGSASFEILRYLVDRLPVMITPKWVSTPSQPIAISDVLRYLVGCLTAAASVGQTYDIGGPGIVSYRDLMDIYAQEAGLPKPLIIPVPVFTPKLSSYWIHLITPVPARIARPLADGLRNPAICVDYKIESLLPFKLATCREAIALACSQFKSDNVEDYPIEGSERVAEWSNPHDSTWAGGTVYEDRRSQIVDAPIQIVWQTIANIGGETGWYNANWLWHLRGWIDTVMGGVGLRRARGRRCQLRSGDELDFWRVVHVYPERSLLLRAEMKVPGDATLQFQLRSISGDQTCIQQTARFVPSGLLGMAYWKLLLPLHKIIFGGMIDAISKESVKRVLLPALPRQGLATNSKEP